MKLETVLFDMGGVLLDMRQSNGLPHGALDFRGRQALLAGAGRNRRLEVDDLEKLVFAPWRLEYRQRYRRGHEAPWAPHLDAWRQRSGSSADDLELLATWFEPYGESLEAVPGALDAVESVRGSGLRTALVSNVPLPGALYSTVLERFGFLDHLEVMLFSYDSGHRKPSPYMAREALNQLGMSATGAVMVGDRKQSDVASGRAAGVATAWIRSEHDEGPSPDWTLDSIGDLPDLLEQRS